METIKEETQTVLKNLYERFMNETNCNNYEKYAKDLEYYRYIRNTWVIPNGRYLRYIDTSDSKNMKLKKGGFVVDSNKYIFKLFDKRYGQLTIDKHNRVFFMKLNNDDAMRSALQKYEI